MNRRQALLAAGGLLAAKSQRAQTSTVTFDDISPDPSIMAGQQESLADLVKICQTTPPGTPLWALDSGYVDAAISWCNLWTQEAIQSGLAARTDQLLDPSDPNGLNGVVVSRM